ncbi:hypothetical protein [Pectinatus sottacetonis]|uniref:hypothetical protein n=1 Tax=Pectinatus sottacetonis TaxID=1002795 RepID=UPI0018C5383B|nr:hypothetical protein [Pectinatus sottacetonis]
MVQENNTKRQNGDNNSRVISYPMYLVDEMRKYYNLPEMYFLSQFIGRKEIQIGVMETSLEKWEEFKHRFTRIYSINQYTDLMIEMLLEYLKPKLEKYYGEKISFWYFFGPYVESTKIYFYSVKIFNDAIFKNIDTYRGPEEEKFASCISGYIRNLCGKGPRMIKVSLVDSYYMVICAYGVIPDYMREYVYNQEEDYIHIKHMMKYLLNRSVDYAFQAEYDYIPQKFTEVDFQNNHILTLAVIRPIEHNIL